MKMSSHSLETYSYNFYAQGAEPMLDSIVVEEWHCRKAMPPLVADDIHLLFFTGGDGVLHINGQHQRVQAGMMAKLFPYHHYAIEPNREITVWRCRFPLSVLMYIDVKKRFSDTDYSVVENGNPLVFLCNEDQTQVAAAFAEMQKESDGAQPHHLNIVLGDLLRMLALFDRECERQYTEQGPHERALAWQALQRLHMYFNMGVIDAANVAVELNIDVGRLGQVLRRLTGKGFSENLHEVRVRNACAMMMFEELPIAFIARYVGYASLSTFYRVFKKMKGLTPEEYKRSCVVNAPIGAHRDTAWKVLVYLLENYADPVTPAAVGEALFIGDDTVEHICKVNFKLSFTALLEQVRLCYACCLLGTETIPISDVAAAAGYNTQRTFTRSFKEHLGTTPGRYRSALHAQHPTQPNGR